MSTPAGKCFITRATYLVQLEEGFVRIFFIKFALPLSFKVDGIYKNKNCLRGNRIRWYQLLDFIYMKDHKSITSYFIEG